jgi:hypothetical protein
LEISICVIRWHGKYLVRGQHAWRDGDE